MKKKTIVLSLVPFFALLGCSESATPDRVVVPSPDVEVSVNTDGSYSQSTANQVNDADKDLYDSYHEAQAGGYKGSIEEWAKVVALYETDPETAVQNARQDGFDQSDIIFATLAGVAISALAAKAMINNADSTTKAYQQQRVNNRTNYAYSQPYDHKAQMAKVQKERERERERGIGGTAITSSGTGYGSSSTNRNSSYPATTANNQSMSKTESKSGGTSYSSSSTNRNSSYPATTANNQSMNKTKSNSGGTGYGSSSTNRSSAYSAMGSNSQSMSKTASKSGGYTSVSRGGFGGAVGRGG